MKHGMGMVPVRQHGRAEAVPQKVVDFLDAPGARSLIACPREVGSECPHCAGEIVLGEPIMVCQACGTVHHRACWKEHVRCGSYSCAPARRPSLERETSAAVLTITQLDLERAARSMITKVLDVERFTITCEPFPCGR